MRNVLNRKTTKGASKVNKLSFLLVNKLCYNKLFNNYYVIITIYYINYYVTNYVTEPNYALLSAEKHKHNMQDDCNNFPFVVFGTPTESLFWLREFTTRKKLCYLCGQKDMHMHTHTHTCVFHEYSSRQ